MENEKKKAERQKRERKKREKRKKLEEKAIENCLKRIILALFKLRRFTLSF